METSRHDRRFGASEWSLFLSLFDAQEPALYGSIHTRSKQLVKPKLKKVNTI